MSKNTGVSFETEVFQLINRSIYSNEFLVCAPHIKLHRQKGYYSKDRDSQIKCDISIEKYLADPDKEPAIRPSIIIVIECKDYCVSISVNEVEEFHAKLQQIGADNTKGIMITKHGSYQKSALTYAQSKGIALARILPENQIQYILYEMPPDIYMLRHQFQRFDALTQINYISDRQSYFSLTNEPNLESLLSGLLIE